MKEMKSVPLNTELYNYILDNFVEEDEVLNELIVETEKLNIPLIQISPDQGKFLYLVTRMINAKKALEIGTLTGFSAIHIARGLSDGGKLTTVEKVEKHAEIAKKYFEIASADEKIEIVISDGLEYMNELVEKNEKFDLIFVDADKINYPNYLDRALKLSHRGTVIVFDNALKDGKIIDKNTMETDVKGIQATNDLMSVKNKNKIESLLIPIGDGFTLGIVK